MVLELEIALEVSLEIELEISLEVELEIALEDGVEMGLGLGLGLELLPPPPQALSVSMTREINANLMVKTSCIKASCLGGYC